MSKSNIQKTVSFVDKYIYEITFVFAAAASIASLILSNIFGFSPCTLCWYQRILMLPLPLILGAAVLRSDVKAFVYVLPMTFIGLLISGYQTLLQWKIIEEASNVCSVTGPSCGEPEILWLGFLTIPFGAFLSFLVITLLMLRAAQLQKFQTGFKATQQSLMSKMILVLAALTAVAVLIVNLTTE